MPGNFIVFNERIVRLYVDVGIADIYIFNIINFRLFCTGSVFAYVGKVDSFSAGKIYCGIVDGSYSGLLIV
jgi:hypothetical protein